MASIAELLKWSSEKPRTEAGMDIHMGEKFNYLDEKAKKLNLEYAAIIALQNTPEYTKPDTLRKMFACDFQVRDFLAELETLDEEEIGWVISVLGFPAP